MCLAGLTSRLPGLLWARLFGFVTKLFAATRELSNQRLSISSFNFVSIGFRPALVEGSMFRNCSSSSLFRLQLLNNFFSTSYPTFRNCFLSKDETRHKITHRLKFKRCSFDFFWRRSSAIWLHRVIKSRWTLCLSNLLSLLAPGYIS